MSEDVELAELSRKAGEYARELRGIARALWNGSMDFDQSFELFTSTIRLRLQSAWYAGAKEYGIAPSELSPEEKTEMASMIASQDSYVYPLLDWVEQNDKAKGGKFAPIQIRISLWANRYDEVYQKAMVMAGADEKTRWTLGVSEHCSSCVKLAGKVKRNSYWNRTGILPRVPGAPYLECRGFNCQCTLVPTDEPLSKGPLPNLP